jgi:hypothetical protein
MKEKIINRLLTVKSIVTLTLTGVFAFLSATGKIAPDAFQDLFYIIVSFYFGSSLERTARANNTTTE